MDSPKDCLIALLRGLGAPPYAVERIVADMQAQGVLAAPDVTYTRDDSATLGRVEALAANLEASGSPAIRGVAKKLRVVLEG